MVDRARRALPSFTHCHRWKPDDQYDVGTGTHGRPHPDSAQNCNLSVLERQQKPGHFRIFETGEGVDDLGIMQKGAAITSGQMAEGYVLFF